MVTAHSDNTAQLDIEQIKKQVLIELGARITLLEITGGESRRLGLRENARLAAEHADDVRRLSAQLDGCYILTVDELGDLLAFLADATQAEDAYDDHPAFLPKVVARWAETMDEMGLHYQTEGEEDDETVQDAPAGVDPESIFGRAIAGALDELRERRPRMTREERQRLADEWAESAAHNAHGDDYDPDDAQCRRTRAEAHALIVVAMTETGFTV